MYIDNSVADRRLDGDTGHCCCRVVPVANTKHFSPRQLYRSFLLLLTRPTDHYLNKRYSMVAWYNDSEVRVVFLECFLASLNQSTNDIIPPSITANFSTVNTYHASNTPLPPCLVYASASEEKDYQFLR